MAAQRIGSYVEVAPGVDIYYEDEGAGAPLVLIPGWTFTTRVFDHQFAAFAGSHRVISFDPRSHGRSTVTSDGNNYTTQAADLAVLLAHLEVENPVILGWSAGSLTGWHHVRNRGTGGIRGFVSVDMPPLGMSCEPDDWVEGAIGDLAGFFQGVQTAQGQRGVVTWYADNVMIEGEISPEVTAWVVEQSLATTPPTSSPTSASPTTWRRRSGWTRRFPPSSSSPTTGPGRRSPSWRSTAPARAWRPSAAT